MSQRNHSSHRFQRSCGTQPKLAPRRKIREVGLKSVRRRAVLRVQCRTPGQRVAKNHHVRRQLCRPCSFPLSQNLAWRCTKQCNPVPNVRLFRAPPPKSTHPQLSRSFLYPSVFSKHPNELGLVCVKTRAEQEPELGIFGAAGGHATCITNQVPSGMETESFPSVSLSL